MQKSIMIYSLASSFVRLFVSTVYFVGVKVRLYDISFESSYRWLFTSTPATRVQFKRQKLHNGMRKSASLCFSRISMILIVAILWIAFCDLCRGNFKDLVSIWINNLRVRTRYTCWRGTGLIANGSNPNLWAQLFRYKRTLTHVAATDNWK